jgi:hypothetical protein
MRKFLLGASLAGLLLTATPILTHAVAQQGSRDQQQQSQADTKTIMGKITSVGNNGHSFVLETNSGGDKQTMQFMLDKNAKVQGKVGVGSDVTVEYQPVEGGQNLALSIAPQG